MLFLVIFNFQLPFIKNSSILALLLSSLLIFLHRKSIITITKQFKSKYLFKLLFFLLLIIVITLNISITLYGSYDISLARHYITLMIQLIITSIVFAIIANRLQSKQEILKMIIVVFILQSVIQILAYLNLNILEVIRNFQDESDIKTSLDYGLIRGLALSGDLYFGLALSYGLVFIIFLKYSLDNQLSKIWQVLCIVLLFIGLIFAGRIGFLGIILGILYVVLYKSKSFTPKLDLLLSVVVTFGFFISVYIAFVPIETRELIQDTVFRYAFQFIYNYIDYGTLSTSSTDELGHMLNMQISEKQIFFGDGYYSSNQGYYMGVDVGYYRHIFYGGFMFLLLFFIFQLMIQNLFQKDHYNERLFKIIIFLYFVLLHIKGMSLGTSKIALTILLLIGLNELFFKEKNFVKA